MTYITNKLKSTLKQHIIIARGKKRIDYRLSYNFYTTYYDNVEIKKIDCEYTYAMPIAILIRHTMSFDNAHFFAQLRHPVYKTTLQTCISQNHTSITSLCHRTTIKSCLKPLILIPKNLLVKRPRN